MVEPGPEIRHANKFSENTNVITLRYLFFVNFCNLFLWWKSGNIYLFSVLTVRRNVFKEIYKENFVNTGSSGVGYANWL